MRGCNWVIQKLSGPTNRKTCLMKLTSKIGRGQSERGYIMLTLLLMIALMTIFAAAILPEITFEIKRDREEEMIHRGVQYSRAIRAYYKKFGRYPAKIEDLENTNQLRFLRKRYKDPLTNKDFRLLHFGEAKLALNAMGMIAGASPISSTGPLTGAPGFSQGPASTGNKAFPSNSGFGQTQNQPASGDASQTGSDAGDSNSSGTASENSSGSGGLGNVTFGGAPIVGVASLSKNPTIRIFDKKKKYNEWQFVYDPTMDRGLLITTPYQQQVGFGVMGTPNLNNQINGPNAGGNSGFGSPNGVQNTNPPANSGLGNPNQPSDTPVQQ
jgi:type II secretory pathway pseudopilin PulG